MKLTTKQIQNIIKEELNRVIKESQEISTVVHDINYAFRYNKGSEEQKKELVNKLFDAYESISPSESEFAKKWIDIFYKEYKGFQKVVNADKLLKYRYFHPPPKPEFVPTQKDISDTSSTPTGITTYDSEQYLRQQDKERERIKRHRRRFKGKDLTNRRLAGKDLRYHDFTGANLSGADLSDAKLYGADLSGAIGLDKVYWGKKWEEEVEDIWAHTPITAAGGKEYMWVFRSNKAGYDKETKWPEGFDPIKAGLKKI